MRMRNYLKKCRMESAPEVAEKLVSVLERFRVAVSKKRLLPAAIILILCAVTFTCINSAKKNITVSDEGMIQLSASPVAATSAKKGVIAIPAGTIKANPFLPYRDIGGSSKVSDVPAYNLVEPPEMVNADSDAARVMDTIVSGILYDKYSPSAILNIEGNDYLVKKGDVVNNYRVLNIAQDSVTVKLGANTYKAGIGEILTEGTLNHNDVSNLSKKFGGER